MLVGIDELIDNSPKATMASIPLICIRLRNCCR